MTDPVIQFSEALAARGIVVPASIVGDGTFQRADVEGRGGKDDATYILHLDGIPAGAICNWKDGLGWQSWRADVGRGLTDDEKRELKAKAQKDRDLRQQEEQRRRQQAKEKAKEVLEGCIDSQFDHPYLEKKGIKPYRLRCFLGQHEVAGMDCHSALVVPLIDAKREIAGVQFIDATGDKRYLGPVSGLYYSIGKPVDGAPLLLAEGVATGHSLHECTGHPVAVALDTGNLPKVAKLMRERFPDRTLVICADDDWKTAKPDGTPWNPGIEAANAAALAVQASVAFPRFGVKRPDDATDFNDMHRLHGPEAVQKAVEAAQSPVKASTPSQPTATATDGPKAVVRRISDVVAKPIDWLWPGRIARGKVTALAGNPGLGKSQTTCWLAAMVTTGGRFPLDGGRCPKGSVVMLSAEDDAADTIRPRLEAAGADVSKCFVLDAVVDGYTGDGAEIRRSFDLKRDLVRLREVLASIEDVALVVVDPISAYLGDTNSHNNAEVRALLAPLSELAAAHGVAVVAVSHLNKGGSNEALMRVTGSLAFVAAARAAYVVVQDKEDEHRRLFLPLKNNIGPDSGGLAFHIETATVGPITAPIQSSRVVWDTEPVLMTADEAMAPALPPEERSDLDDAVAFLEDLLRDGPVRTKHLKQEAEGAGHSWATIRRASRQLRVEAEKLGMKEGWQWRLPPSEPPKMLKTPEDAQPFGVSTFGENEHLREPVIEREVF